MSQSRGMAWELRAIQKAYRLMAPGWDMDDAEAALFIDPIDCGERKAAYRRVEASRISMLDH